jgi:biopolymer transport protein ExbD
MGEVNTDNRKKSDQKSGLVKKGKKLSTRVDMTPMVDLAFLLLTFFLLATTFIKPQIMTLVLPEKNTPEQNTPKVNEKNVLSIVLGAGNKVYWYIGFTGAQVKETNYSDTGLRKVLMDETKANEKLVVLIKPDDKSTYENLVTTLDELTITGTSRYALVTYDPDDKALVNAFTGGASGQPAGGKS